MQPALAVSNVREHRKGSLLAFFDLTLASGMVIRGLTLHESHGKRWVSFPARQWTKQDGSLSWTPVVELPRPRMDALRDALLPLLDAELLGAADQA